MVDATIVALRLGMHSEVNYEVDGIVGVGTLVGGESAKVSGVGRRAIAGSRTAIGIWCVVVSS